MTRDPDNEIFILPDEQYSDGPFEPVVRISVLSGQHAGGIFNFVGKEHIMAGSHENADVHLDDKGVAPGHLMIQKNDRSYMFRATDSTKACINAQTGKPVGYGTLIPKCITITLGAQGPILQIEIGLVIPFNNYQFIGRLGGGGMAEVFLARQKGIGGFIKNVAIKLIHPDIFNTPNAEQMFLDEARIAAELNHNNVVRTHEVGRRGDSYFISMEYLRGLSIYDIKAEFDNRGLLMPPELAVALMSQACDGLHALHELRDAEGRPMNVVHRDISHSNLMCTPDGVVKVIDFGLAKDRYRVQLSDPKILKGKPAYMSPEQVQSRPLDKRTDIWAVGVMLHELCTGENLFAKDDIVGTLMSVINQPIPALSEVCDGISPLLDAAFAKALNRTLEARYQTAQAFAMDLRKIGREYGGHFLSEQSIAKYLTELGIDLKAKKPSILNHIPDALRAAKKTSAAMPTGIDYVNAPNQLSDKIIANGFYKLFESSGKIELVGESIYHLKFIAQVISQHSIAPPIDITKPSINKPLLISLIGRNKELTKLSQEEHRTIAEYTKCRQQLTDKSGDAIIPFTTIHECGIAWPDGPTYIAYPYVTSTLNLKELSKLSITDKLPIIEQLVRTLKRAIDQSPTFVHGEIRPENISVVTDAKKPQFTLLGFGLSAILSTSAPVSDDPFLAPECRQGAPPTSSSDVYSLGALIFTLLDGDLSKLNLSVIQGKEIPRLPPSRERPAYVEPAVLTSLDRNPRSRPPISDLLNRLLPPPPSPVIPARSGLVIYPPPPRTVVSYQTSSGQEVKVNSIEIALSQTRRPIPLALANSENILPAPLVLITKGASIEMELAAPPSGADAPQLYRSAHEPATKLRSYPMAFIANEACVEFGHRRTWVQRIYYSSVTAESEETNLTLSLPEHHIEIVSHFPLLRLITLRTTDHQTGCIYLVCISVRM